MKLYGTLTDSRRDFARLWFDFLLVRGNLVARKKHFS